VQNTGERCPVEDGIILSNVHIGHLVADAILY
jgi:hypothetical protein